MHHGMCNWGLIQEKLASDAERFQKKYDVAALVPVEVFFFFINVFIFITNCGCAHFVKVPFRAERYTSLLSKQSKLSTR